MSTWAHLVSFQPEERPELCNDAMREVQEVQRQWTLSWTISFLEEEGHSQAAERLRKELEEKTRGV